MGALLSTTLALASMGGMALTFFGMCVVCDEHLVPAIEVFIEQFNMPEDVAGVTLIAFGAAAPELLLNLLSGAEGTSSLSLSALLGSSIIAFGLIPPLCIIMTPHKEIELSTWPILREVTFYLIGLFTFLAVLQDGEFSAKEAATSCAIYGAYVLLVVLSFVWNVYYRPGPVGIGHGTGMRSAEGSDGKTETEMEDMTQLDRRMHGVSMSPAPFAGAMGNQVTARPAADALTGAVLFPAQEKEKAGNSSVVNSEWGASPADRDDSIPLLDAVADEEGGVGRRSSPTLGSSGVRSRSATEGDDVETVVRVPNGTQQVMLQYLRMCWAGIWQRLGPHAIAAWNSVTAPIDFAIKSTTPKLYQSNSANAEDAASAQQNKQGKQKVTFMRASGALAMSVLWIALLAWCIIEISESLIKHMGVGTSTVGATLVALGSQIPDAIASIALARSGYFDSAMAGAIGSQVINITIGVGFPIMLSIWYTGVPLKIDNQETRSLWLLTGLLLLVVCGYVCVTLPVATMWQSLTCKTTQKYTHMKRLGAWQLLSLLTLVTISFVWLNEEVMDEITDDIGGVPAVQVS
jgi:Ca2+/Na+ antiporter